MKAQTNRIIRNHHLQQSLRRNPTEAEMWLWSCLRRRQMHGFKFRRQHPFGDYILDFVCLEARLVIEADGGQHVDRRQEDAARMAFLEQAGFQVLRFWNNQVLAEIDAVKDEVSRMLLARMKELGIEPHPHPNPPLDGKGTCSQSGDTLEKKIPQAPTDALNNWQHTALTLSTLQGDGWGGDGVNQHLMQAHLENFLKCNLNAGGRVLLGLSGGLDSRVLLHMLVAARRTFDFHLSALHVNHGISPNAEDWADFCANICAQDEIPFETVAVNVPRDAGLGLEAAARAERYSVLLDHEADAVMLAHHQDDQAETLMLQLLRGAGVKGLAAMGDISHQRSAISGQHKAILRPLLGISRAQLLEYAEANDLQWIDDESNLDLSYDRNFLRHHIFPELEQRFPACRKTMARSASHLAEAAELLEEIAREDAVKVVSDGKLNLAELKQLSAPRAGNLLRYWVTETSGLSLSAARIEDIRSQLLDARIDARVAINIGGRMLRRKRGIAFIE